MMLLLLIMGHILADFYFQSSKMADRKSQELKYTIFHGLIYLGTLAIICFCFLNWSSAILATAILSLTHYFIDWIKSLILRIISEKKHSAAVFFADQLAHISIIISVFWIFHLQAKTNTLFEYFSGFDIFEQVLSHVLTVLILLKPSSILVKNVFIAIDNNKKTASETYNTGALIGYLERIMVSVLIIINQYSAVGLVLTAKSIARFKQFEDKNFAERYLVGTLLSILVAIVVTILLK